MLKVMFNYIQESFWSSSKYIVTVFNRSDDVQYIQSISYPHEKSTCTAVQSTLSLVVRPGKQYWSYNNCCVVLKQQEKDKLSSFVLAECHKEEDGMIALDSINTTLSPFLNNGTITFSKALLESLITPQPCSYDNLSSHLITTMEQSPHIYPHWYKIGQVLSSLPLSLHTTSLAPTTNSSKLLFDTSNLIVEDTTSSLKDHQEEYYTPAATTAQQSFEFPSSHSSSPLFISCTNGYIRSTLSLLLGGANPNSCIDPDGNTPLHVAAQQGNVTLIKLLIAFEADTRTTNNRGHLPLDVALDAGAYDCAIILKQVSLLLDAADNLSKDYNRTSNVDAPCLLSLDGGGVRAIMEIQILIAIEKRMKQLSPWCPSIMNSFDYIAGTSGGAYVLFITLYGKRSLAESRSLVFSAMSRLSSLTNERERVHILEDILKDMLGEETVMTDVQSPHVIVTSTLADRSPSTLHLITNYGKSRNGQLGPSDRKAWEAARITSAVPIVFGSYDGKFLDGGLMSNNPTLDAMSEILTQDNKLGLVLSLGTGKAENHSISNVDVSIPSLSISSLLKLPQSLRGLKNLCQIVLMQLTSSDGQDVDRCTSWCHQMGAEYHRISPPVSTSHQLDESNINKIIGMLYDAQLHVLKEAETIDQIAKTLLLKNCR